MWDRSVPEEIKEELNHQIEHIEDMIIKLHSQLEEDENIIDDVYFTYDNHLNKILVLLEELKETIYFL